MKTFQAFERRRHKHQMNATTGTCQAQ